MNKIAYIYQTDNNLDYTAKMAANGFKNAFIDRGDSFRFFDINKIGIPFWPAEKIKLINFNPDIILTDIENIRHLPLNILQPAALVLWGAFYSACDYDDRIHIVTEKVKKILNKYSSKHNILILSPYNEQINERFFSGYETELKLKVIQLLHCTNKTQFAAPILKPEFDFLWLGDTTRRITTYKSFIGPLKKEFNNYLEYTQHNMISPEIVEAEKLYSRAFITPNLHTDAQIKHNMLLNERVFTASALGGFQICNNPLARKYFKEDELVIATESSDFIEKTHYYISHPNERLEMIKKMQANILKNHTYFNRIETLLASL
jgi:hypothetical protein